MANIVTANSLGYTTARHCASLGTMAISSCKWFRIDSRFDLIRGLPALFAQARGQSLRQALLWRRRRAVINNLPAQLHTLSHLYGPQTISNARTPR